jgi:hypothetical protein
VCTGADLREDQEAAVSHVERQVHEDFDTVLADELDHLVVGPAHDVAPDVDFLAEAPREVIGTNHIAIAKDLELPMIVLS